MSTVEFDTFNKILTSQPWAVAIQVPAKPRHDSTVRALERRQIDIDGLSGGDEQGRPTRTGTFLSAANGVEDSY
jgi:hypothetical protein